jgi:hypothetical protein
MSNDFDSGFAKKLAKKISDGMNSCEGCLVIPTLLGVMVSGTLDGVKCTEIVEGMTGEQLDQLQKHCDSEDYDLAARYIESLKG